MIKMSKVDKLIAGCLIAGMFIGIFACSLALAILQGGIFFIIEIISAFMAIYIGYRLTSIAEDIKNGNL